MNRRTWLWLGLGGAGLLCAGVFVAKALDSSRRFEFSRNPSDIVLHVSYQGGMVAMSPDYSIFGDGRILIDEFLSTKKEPNHPTFEARLSVDDLEAMLQDAVDCGLMEYDHRKIEQRRIKAGTYGPPPTDIPAALITIYLDLYERPDGELVGPVSHRFAVDEDRMLALLNPGIPEFAVVERLLGKLRELHKTAKGQGK